MEIVIYTNFATFTVPVEITGCEARSLTLLINKCTHLFSKMQIISCHGKKKKNRQMQEDRNICIKKIWLKDKIYKLRVKSFYRKLNIIKLQIFIEIAAQNHQQYHYWDRLIFVSV